MGDCFLLVGEIVVFFMLFDFVGIVVFDEFLWLCFDLCVVWVDLVVVDVEMVCVFVECLLCVSFLVEVFLLRGCGLDGSLIILGGDIV